MFDVGRWMFDVSPFSPAGSPAGFLFSPCYVFSAFFAVKCPIPHPCFICVHLWPIIPLVSWCLGGKQYLHHACHRKD